MLLFVWLRGFVRFPIVFHRFTGPALKASCSKFCYHFSLRCSQDSFGGTCHLLASFSVLLKIFSPTNTDVGGADFWMCAVKPPQLASPKLMKVMLSAETWLMTRPKVIVIGRWLELSAIAIQCLFCSCPGCCLSAGSYWLAVYIRNNISMLPDLMAMHCSSM